LLAGLDILEQAMADTVNQLSATDAEPVEVTV